MDTAAQDRTGFTFVGGALCLDFTNTVSWHLAERPVEHLATYPDLVAWAGQAGLLDAPQQARLRAHADTAALGRAVQLREALFRTLRGEARAGDLPMINEVLAEGMATAVLRPDTSPDAPAFAWDWTQLLPDRILWAVARSAAELLSSPAAGTVSMCANGECGWLFLDPAHRRRWCSMRGCGNRAKAARYYQRHKPGSDDGS